MFFRKDDPDERTVALIRAEEERSEKLINYWRLGLSFFFFAITAIISGEIPPHSTRALYTGSAIYFFYSLFMLIYLRAGHYRSALKYLNLLLDIVLLSFIIWNFGTFRTFKTEAFLLYFMWIALGSMRFSLSLTLFAGALCVVCYMVVIIMGLNFGTIETGTITDSFVSEKVSLLNQAVKVIYLILVTLVLAYGSRLYMKLARRSRAQEMEAERQGMRAQRLESIGFLAGGIAHDFNNILAIISNNLQVARLRLDDPDKAARKLDAIAAALEKASGLTGQLLTFSRGGAPIRRTMRVEDIIGDAARLAFTGSSVRYHIRYPLEYSQLSHVSVDGDQMNQVLNNIFINAIQASPRGSTVEVSAVNRTLKEGDDIALPPGRYVLISVSDHGPVIEPENLQRIFDLYFTTREGSNGLGLSTAYSIVKRHKGLLWAENVTGGGARFNIMLPAVEAPPEQAALELQAAQEGRLPALRILVMDDEKDFRDSVGEALEMSGHSVFFAGDGQRALLMYSAALDRGEPFDIVIMDLTIPGGMGGAETIEKLLTIDNGARVIVASGYSNDPVMADYGSHGFMGILPKPFNMEQMRRELLRVWKL